MHSVATGNVLLGLVCGINGNDPFAPWGAVVRKGHSDCEEPSYGSTAAAFLGTSHLTPYPLSTSSGITPCNMLDLVASKAGKTGVSLSFNIWLSHFWWLLLKWVRKKILSQYPVTFRNQIYLFVGGAVGWEHVTALVSRSGGGDNLRVPGMEVRGGDTCLNPWAVALASVTACIRSCREH